MIVGIVVKFRGRCGAVCEQVVVVSMVIVVVVVVVVVVVLEILSAYCYELYNINSMICISSYILFIKLFDVYNARCIHFLPTFAGDDSNVSSLKS